MADRQNSKAPLKTGNAQQRPDIIAGEKLPFDQYNAVVERVNQTAIDNAHTTVLTFIDYVIPPVFTQSGQLDYTFDFTNATIGSGFFIRVDGDGSDITFPSEGTETTISTTNGERTKLVLQLNQITPSIEVEIVELGVATTPTPTAPTISNFIIADANHDRITFNSSKVITATTFAGFTLADPTKTISSIFINVGQTTGHYFVVSVAYVAGDQDPPTIAYDGTDDWQDTETVPLDLALFTAQPITNSIAGAPPNAPIFTFASFEVGNIDDSTIDLPTDATLDGTSIALTTDFVLRINATPDPVTNVTYNGQNVRLTSTTPIENGDVVDIAYSGTAVRNNASPNTPAATFTTTSVTNNVAVGAFDPSTISTEFLGLPLDIANTNADPVTLASDILTTTPYNFSNVGTVNRAIENSEECIRVGDVEGNLESVSSALSGLFQDSFSFHMKVKLDDATPLATQYFCRINNGTISRFWIDLRSTGLITVAYTANSVNVFAQTNAAVALSTTDFSQLVVTVPSGGTIDILLDGASQALNPSFDGDMSGVNMALFNSAAAQLNIASEDIGASRIDGWVRQVYLQDVVYTAQNITDLGTL